MAIPNIRHSCFLNSVYVGNLRDMSHEEMLLRFSDIILCFYDAEDISIFQLDVPENAYKKYNYYEPHRFIIEVKNSHEIQKERRTISL